MILINGIDGIRVRLPIHGFEDERSGIDADAAPLPRAGESGVERLGGCRDGGEMEVRPQRGILIFRIVATGKQQQGYEGKKKMLDDAHGLAVQKKGKRVPQISFR